MMSEYFEENVFTFLHFFFLHNVDPYLFIYYSSSYFPFQMGPRKKNFARKNKYNNPFLLYLLNL